MYYAHDIKYKKKRFLKCRNLIGYLEYCFEKLKNFESSTKLTKVRKNIMEKEYILIQTYHKVYILIYV